MKKRYCHKNYPQKEEVLYTTGSIQWYVFLIVDSMMIDAQLYQEE